MQIEIIETISEIINIMASIVTVPAWCGAWIITTLGVQIVASVALGVEFTLSLQTVAQIVFGLFISGVWGVLVDEVIALKGYNKNWFWWGAIFGFFALFVAVLRKKAEVKVEERTKAEIEALEQKTLDNGGWKCDKCGKVMSSCVGMCGCGRVRAEQIQ